MTKLSKHNKLGVARKKLRLLSKRNPDRQYVINGTRATGYTLYSYRKKSHKNYARRGA